MYITKLIYRNLGKFCCYNSFAGQESNENLTHKNLLTIIKTTIIHGTKIMRAFVHSTWKLSLTWCTDLRSIFSPQSLYRMSCPSLQEEWTHWQPSW